METDALIGQIYERPGSEAGEDRWQVVAVRKDEHGPLVTLRARDGETVTLALRHLREPYWRPIESSEAPEFE